MHYSFHIQNSIFSKKSPFFGEQITNISFKGEKKNKQAKKPTTNSAEVACFVKNHKTS